MQLNRSTGRLREEAPDFLSDPDEWPRFDCGFQCPNTGHPMGVRWEGPLAKPLVTYLEDDDFGPASPDTREWGDYFATHWYDNAHALVQDLLDAGCYLSDLL